MKNLKFILAAVLLHMGATQLANASLTAAWNKKITNTTGTTYVDAVKLSANSTISLSGNILSGTGFSLVRVSSSGTLAAGPVATSMNAQSLVLDESINVIYVIGAISISSNNRVCVEKRSATTLALVSQITFNFSNTSGLETGMKGAVDANHNLYVAGIVNTGASFGDEICFLKINSSAAIVTNRVRNYQPGNDFITDCGLMTFNGSTDFYVCGSAIRNQSTNPDREALVAKFSTVNFATLWERKTDLNTGVVGFDEWNDMELHNGVVHLAGVGVPTTSLVRKAAYKSVHSNNGTDYNSFTYDTGNNFFGAARKVQLDPSSLPIIGIEKDIINGGFNRKEITLVKINTAPFPNTIASQVHLNGNFLGTCLPHVFFGDMVSSPGKTSLFVTGFAQECTPSGLLFQITASFTTAALASTGFDMALDATVNQSLGFKVFGINDASFIATFDWTSTSSGLADGIWIRKYSVVAPRLASGNTAEVESANSFLQGLNVFPNPASATISLTGFENNLQIVLMDIAGKIVFKKSIVASEKIDVGNLPRGNYLLVCTDAENKTSHQRIVLQ